MNGSDAVYEKSGCEEGWRKTQCGRLHGKVLSIQQSSIYWFREPLAAFRKLA